MSLSAKARTLAPSARVRANPSLRWRIRRWVLQKLDAWPREKSEPKTEWRELRRAERLQLQVENARLTALENRLTRWLEIMTDGAGPRELEWIEHLRGSVVDGRLEELLGEFPESELNARRGESP